MKIRPVAIAATVLLAGAASAWAQAPAPAAADGAAAPAWQGHARHGMMMGRGFFGALHQLNLTADQKAQVKAMLKSAHESMKASRGANAAEFVVRNNPGDPNFATAMQTMQSNASQRIQELSQIETQIYGLLTPAQRAQLPTVLADMQSKMQAHRAAWQAAHPRANPPSAQ